MDSQSIRQAIEFVGSWGVILSPQQKASLQTSLFLLLNRQNFSRVQFWGKIAGIQDDYYIAQGFSVDHFAQRKTFYSKNCIHWSLLNPPTKETLQKSCLIRGRFTGDPSYEAQRTIKTDVDSKNPNEEVITLKEEDRLSAVIADITHDVVIIPRKSYIKAPNGEVYPNRHFEGHGLKEAMRLYNYVHFRKSELLLNKPIIERADFDESIDFMDSIDNDSPKGSWIAQHDRFTGVISIKSLLWLGYIFYHIPGTTQYGSIYVGTGEKNIDLPFMI